MVLVALDLGSLCAVLEIEDGLARGIGELGFGRGVVWRGRGGGGRGRGWPDKLSECE